MHKMQASSMYHLDGSMQGIMIGVDGRSWPT